ncbi:MAG: peptidoglycan editing factor PgeF [Campylobacteraceae bacterium]|jgi:YfiH family protein|nr:peptidoglycan editing factor PgeF [Campylobacteraceae bacterium]
MERYRQDNGDLLMKEVFLDKSFQVIVSDKTGGVSTGVYESLNLGLHVGDNLSHVQKNREIFASYFGANTKDLCFMEQVHGVLVVNAKRGETPKADALITNKRDLVLCVMSADCMGVILYDNDKKAVAAIHAGRKGAFANIVTNTILAMEREFGSKRENIHSFIGAGIKSCCYEIKDEVLKEAQKSFSWALHERWGRWFLNLPSIIKSQLITNGVKKIIYDDTCTCCDKNYFSYRRDGVCGRFATGVKIL